ncbi:MAG TPA: hypothetical protein VNL91_03405 [Thermoanaerobaculia bacterium]|nr:hypothetical protein [Thermoanaerobaculia bacterium]
MAVVVAMADAEPEEYSIFLSPYSAVREGPETLADYVNGRRRFFPMLKGGVAKMINRDHIVWFRCERLPAVSDIDVTIIERTAILELSDGTRLEGSIPVDRPREHSRISDVLNDGCETFVRLDDDTASTYFVNKNFIRQVIPL